MKIEITHYGNKASYECFPVTIGPEDLIYHLEKLIRLTGYHFDGTLEIVKDEQ